MSKTTKKIKKIKKTNKKTDKKDTFMFYPEIKDQNFFKNIYVKKEFFKNRITKESRDPEEVCNPSEFILMPHQEFLRNFISQDTPYNGILIFHGTGFGKTCSGISVAEGFKDILNEMNKRALVILGAKIRQNFKKKIYDLEKEYYKKKPDDIVQCTGNTYTITQSGLTYKQKLRKVNNEINANYEFFGPEQLSNYVMKKITNWDGNPKHLSPQNIRAIQKEFSNRIIIIDEVHNIKTVEAERSSDIFKKKSPTIIETIIRYAQNIRLVLMSATPMFDRPREIIYILNLLLLNDNKKPLKEIDIFDKNDNLKPDGIVKLQKASQGYISYLVGKSPLIFPLRVTPKDAVIPNINIGLDGKPIKEEEQIKISKLVPIPMGKIQNQTYNRLTKSQEKKKVFGTNETLAYAANYVFPNDKGEGVLARDAFRNFDDGKGAFVKVFKTYKDLKTGKMNKAMYFKYQKHAILNRGSLQEKPFLDIDMVESFSSKLSYLLKNIRKSKGIIYIYSRWINPGVIPIALALEQNGYQRYTFPGETPLLDYSPNPKGAGGKRRGICYLCGEDISNPIHNNKSKKFDHQFGLAKYILLTGTQDISNIDPNDAADVVNKASNKYGKDIKIIIGTRVSGEGIDFSRIRQVYIMEPWFNYSRIEQVEGRAIRNCSHIDLPKEERNVEIFHLTSIFPDKKEQNKETIDLKNYRISENKYIKIKNVEDILRKSAVDCALNKNGNYNVVKDTIPVKTALGDSFNFNMSKDLNKHPRVYRMDPIVDYECVWEPSDKFLKEMKINTDTYNIRFAKSDIQTVIKYIKLLFRYNVIFDMDTIVNFVKRYIPSIEKNFIYKALDIILNDPKEFIFDKYNRRGRMIYRGNYYIFQPLEINNPRLPVYYRSQPLTFKNKHLILTDLLREMVNTENNTNTNINKEIIDKLQNEYKEYMKILNDVMVYNDIKFGPTVINVIINMILDKFNNKDLIDIAYTTIELMLKNPKEFKSNKVAIYILNYLKDKGMIVEKSKNLIDPQLSNIKTGDVVGFVFDDKYYCRTGNNLDICESVLQQKIAYLRELKLKKPDKREYFEIMGYYENDGNKKNQFKIIDLTKTRKGKTKSKTLPSGRACGSHKMEDLFKIRKKIGMKKPEFSTKAKREDICLEVEFFMRYLDEKCVDKKTWFISDRKV